MKHKRVFVGIEWASKNKYKKITAISEDEKQYFEYILDQDDYEIDVQKMLSKFTTFCKENCDFDDCQNCDVYLLEDVSLCDTLLSFLASVDWVNVSCIEWLYGRYVLHTKPIQYYKKNGKLHKVYYKETPIPNALPFKEYIKQQGNVSGPYSTKKVSNHLVQDVGKLW